MASFNKVILAGNLTRDPQLTYLPSNTAVCDFGIAVNRRFKDKDGNPKDDVCYVDIQSFGKTAEAINQYFQKGKPILIEGRLRYRERTSKDGQKRSKLEVVLDSFSFLESGGGKRDDQPRARQGQPEDNPATADSDIPF